MAFHASTFVAEIRNKFAHETNISFDNATVVKLCKDLKWHEISMMMKTLREATPREIFKVNINTLVSHLSAVSSIAKIDKRSLKIH